MNEQIQARKFLFDLSFDDGIGKTVEEREKPKPTYSQEQLDQAKKDSFQEGLSAGQKAMMEDQQQYMNVLLSEIDQKLGHIIDSSRAEWQRQLAQLQEIALVIVRKVLPNYVAKHGLGEIEVIVAKVIAEVGREPRLVFRVCESQFDDASARINAIAAQSAYAGKLVILGDPEIGPSDCRIEWADGGIERDIKKLWNDIDRVMEEVQTFESTVMEDAASATSSPKLQTQQPPAMAQGAPSETGEQT